MGQVAQDSQDSQVLQLGRLLVVASCLDCCKRLTVLGLWFKVSGFLATGHWLLFFRPTANCQLLTISPMFHVKHDASGLWFMVYGFLATGHQLLATVFPPTVNCQPF